MFEQMKLFFDLPDEAKQKVIKKNHLVGGYEGWRFYDLTKTGDGGKKGVPDEDGKGGWNEGFAIAPEWGTNCFPQASEFPPPAVAPSNDEGGVQKTFDPLAFESTCKEYFHAAQELGRHVLGMIAEGLGVETDFFEGYLDKQNSFCRLTHYFRPLKDGQEKGINGEEEPLEEGAAAHTDWGALTLLIQDTIGGLQVYDRSAGKWHEVPPYPIGTAIVCNIGDLLARWTNDTYRSTLHRVIAPKRGVHRYSIPFFNPGNPSFTIKTIPTCVPEGSEPRYPSITAGEYITSKHLESTGAKST